MAAPEIPNLLSMRGNRSRGGGRGRGGPSNISDGGPAAANAVDKEKSVRDTDTDANGSRRSAVDCGYLVDPYVAEFGSNVPVRRMPIINRGAPPTPPSTSSLHIIMRY